MKQEIFTPGSSMTGVNLECPRSFMEDKRWEVPDFMKVLPIGVRANVIYRVHVLLDNIDIGNREELLAIHTDMKTWLELQPSERSIESAQFLALQIQLARRVFH